MPIRTSPLAGDALFAVLSGRDEPRPELDDGLVSHLRGVLESAAAASVGLPPDVVVRVTKASAERVRRCESRHLAELGQPTPVTAPLVRGRLLDAVFRRVVTCGTAGDDLWTEAIAACAADGDDIDGALESLAPSELAEVQEEVVDRGALLEARWPHIPPAASLRTQERSAVRLAAGRVVLTSRPDVTFGRVLSGGSRVCLVEAKSGLLQLSHHADLRFYALVEALRWGAPPQRASTYSLADGKVATLVPNEDELLAAADTAADAISRLVRLALGAEPGRNPTALCPSCPLVGSCADGQRQLALTHGAPAAIPDDDDEDVDQDEDLT